MLVFSLALNFFVFKPFQDAAGAGQMQKASELVENKIGTLVEQVGGLALTARDWGISGSFDVDDVQRFNRVFMPLVTRRLELSTVILADDSGREMLLMQTPNGEWMNRISNTAEWGARRKIIRWRALDDMISEEWMDQEYDARTRPWFVGAMTLTQPNDVFWTEPYVLVSSNEPGISAGVRWQTQAGENRVLSLGVRLIDLSRFTMALKINEHGTAALLTDDGRVIGTPADPNLRTDADIERKILRTLDEDGFDAHAMAVARWERNGRPLAAVTPFDYQGDSWLARIYSVSIGSNALSVVAVAPASDFLPLTLRRLAGSFALVLLVVAPIGVFLAVISARRFSAPLEALADESKRLGTMDLARPIEVSTELLELRQLVDAQERMRLALLGSTAELERSNQELESRVESRTRALSESEAQLRAIFKHTGMGIVTRSVDRQLLTVNDAYLEFVGYSREELAKIDVYAFLSAEDWQRFKDALERMRTGGMSVYRAELKYRRQDGTARWGNMVTSAIRDADGTLIATATMVSDITANKESAALLQALIDRIPVPVFYKGADTRMMGCNRAYREAFGVSLEDFVGKRVLDLTYLPLEERLAYQAEDERVIAEGSTLRKDVQFTFADGSVHATLYSIGGFRAADGGPGGLVGVIVDVTELRQTQEALSRAKEVAEDATRTKSMFLANMSHEIRTPMNAVIGLSYLALKTQLNARQRDYVEKIHNAGTSLLGIINDILDFSKMEAGELDIESIEFDLEEVMSNVSTLVGEKVFAKGLELLFDVRPDVPTKLIGDPLRLGQILVNLVNNAVKFTERGEVRVSVRVAERLGNKAKVEFQVIDTGIGMNEEQAQRLFRPFTQADGSTTRKYGGTGLGLTISKRLVELMGGRISVESELHRGSTFTFTAWLAFASEAAVAAVVPQELNDMRVLVVDDNAAARELLVDRLHALPFQVDQVASGAESIEAVRQAAADHQPYQVVLMDWKMPGMSGVEAARLIKRIPDSPAVIIVTAFGRDDVRAEVEQARLDGFLVKPVSASALLNAILQTCASAEDESVEALESGADYGLHGVRLLLAEDNEINQQLAVELLESVGATVDVAENGRIAVEKLLTRGEHAYDAVLMDLQMPEMDGYEAVARIRAHASFAQLPIIAMTAHAMPEERERCFASGMNDHITKPIDPEGMYHTIRHWVRSRNGAARAEQARAEAEQAAATASAPPQTSTGDVWMVIPGVDTTVGLSRAAGKRALYRSLLEKYAMSQADAAAEVAAALAAGERSTAERIAHTAKSVSGSIGALAAQEASAQAERAIREGTETTAVIDAMGAAIGEVASAIRAAFAAMFASDSPAAETTAATQVDAVAARAVIERLVNMLESSDGGVIDYYADVRDVAHGVLGRERAQDIERAISNFDFAAALDQLRRHTG
ncbi:MAG: response regulator [Nevskiaceae bacterium]|nr:response regulator [Nevskiaceae bacterium]